MSRSVVCGFAVLVVACAVGCGNSSNTTTALTVNIRQNRFFPKSLTVGVGNTVQWINVDNSVHQVVSGVLSSTPNPHILTPVISIGQDNIFVPSTFEANLGDTVQWQNNRTGPFVMDILDDSNTVRATLTFTRSGQLIGFSGFPGAGFYTFQQQGNSNFFGTITVFGRPTPDNNFNSQPLIKGGTFTTQFSAPGTFPYYDLNQSDPNQSFMTGTITVQ